MAVTENLFTGDGSTVLFSFTFPYLNTTDVKASLNNVVTTAYSIANATQLQFTSAPANGVAIRIFRETSDDSGAVATFSPGAPIRSADLNDNFTQNRYLSQEAFNSFVTADRTKLDGIETGATADQTPAEIKTAYESNADTNAFTDADHTKLDGIEASATADQSATEIKTAYESNSCLLYTSDAADEP